MNVIVNLIIQIMFLSPRARILSSVRRHVLLWAQKLLVNFFKILTSHSQQHVDVQVIF